jgi:ATP-dependent exoDNAse (exonuclease V) beta subunit
MHLYWDENGKYVSVTTLIGKFCQDFDSNFWSGYKALEKLLSAEEFKIEKSQLQKTRKIDVKYFCDMYGFTVNDFNKAQQDILDEWAKTNAESCERGSKIHSELENKYLSKGQCDMKKFGLGGKFEVNTNKSLMDKNTDILKIDRGVFPEYLIYRNSPDGKFKLAGQIDLLIKDGNDIYIIDYKTNKKLDDKSFFDSRTKKCVMMKYPMNNLMDCNKMHYTLQLSTYAWMLQKLNPEFVIKKLMLIHYDHQGNVTEHELEYLKDDVERMCKFYKKQSMLETLKASRRPIEF